MKKGIKLLEEVMGTGATACKGSIVEIRSSGFLTKGDCFLRDEISRFMVGKRELVAAWEYTVDGMRVGGTRKVKVSPHLAYGDKGIPGVVPPQAVLILVIELLSVEPVALPS